MASTQLENSSELAARLPQYIATRRWFRSKTRTIERAEIRDAMRVPETNCFLLFTRLHYAEGSEDDYVLTLVLGEDAHEEEEALSRKEFRDWLLSAIACDQQLSGTDGDLAALRTAAFKDECGSSALKMESSVSRAEQSNTSIIYGDQFILKLFRKVEEGINPDIEIGRFLTEHGFSHTPAVLGSFEYRAHEGARYAVGILQKFVSNQGDAWKYTLDSLREFFERASRSRETPQAPAGHPLDLAQNIPHEVRDLLGGYAESARLLGERTAQMHAVLAQPGTGPDFATEPFAAADGQKLYDEILGQADITFELLRRKQAILAGTAKDEAASALRLEHRILERISPLRTQKIDAARIRFHGDYHLGQVLYTGSDFMIIDFEGEPARPLKERRGKTLAMRDVAGMLRSFQYAAYAAPNATESWSTYWNAWASALYLNGYLKAAENSAFLPRDRDQQRLLIDAFLLQKALYEVAYELNNRPDWVRIPLRGILNLVS